MSISVTRTVPKSKDARTVIRPERVYDYLYDPVYTVSSEVDHARSGLKAYTTTDRVLEPTDPVPPSIDRRWRGQTEQRKEALHQLAGVVPNAQSWLKREECHVAGADRWKYFKRPLIPFAQQLPPDVIFDFPREDFVPTYGNNAEKQPTHITVGVQTDYRESETQTDPYSPDYVIQPRDNSRRALATGIFDLGYMINSSSPFIMYLFNISSLPTSRGLPAGLAEVEMIQRARAKQAWEATLPPLDDLSQLDKRRRMMEEMEVKEWAFREGEIQKLQEARLAVLKDLLTQRDEAQKEVTSERLNQIYSKHQKDKETRLQKIDNDYMRSLRKLEARSRNVEGKIDRSGIFREHTDSKTFALWTCGTNKSNGFKSHYLETYEGLLKLEARLFASAPKRRVTRRKPKDVIKPPVSKVVKLMEKYKGDEEIELAVINLQKLLRGRSIQFEKFKGKEDHQELLYELRTVHALQREEQELQKADKHLVMTLKKQRDKQIEKTSQEEASQARVVGAELEHLFDTLSKELIHLQEERRIHAFTLLAERDRRLREAEESGRRQVEERRRREEDEIFRQVVQVHQETVDLYLEDIILGTMEQAADQQAREEIHRKAQEVNDIAYAMEESRNSLQSEEIVSELVYSFLIPEVEKISLRQRVHQRQHRHFQAARSIIQGAAEHSGILPSTPGASESPCPSERASDRVVEETFSQVEQEQRKEAEQHRPQTEDSKI
ncbi:Cilia-and flagella-associated protein 91 [Nibea albiflora]|uniref:Cilia-and flagella-associated protein 91 n=1 Tax=Nibea albiflora TaxID=240163 RepID=A0ACB7EFK6_NIBAL|nr:Cilia-and flagella-associated protein 91 [Nibea albiflora]